MPIDHTSPYNRAVKRAAEAILARRDFTEYFKLSGVTVPATGYQLLESSSPAPRGYVVGLIAGNTANNPLQEVLRLLEKVKEAYLLKPTAPEITGAHITVGGWMDTQTGIYHLDGGLRILQLPFAMQLAENHAQIAIWDEQHREVLDVKFYQDIQRGRCSNGVLGGVWL